MSKLILTEKGYYVHKSCRYYDELNRDPIPPKYYRDVNLQFPKPLWDEKYDKWKVEIVTADCGGYDTTILPIWFNTLEDFFLQMNITRQFLKKMFG